MNPGTTEVESRLLRALAAWSVASIAAGGAIWWLGAATDRRAVAAFGRQNLMWGAIDGVIAGAGMARQRQDDSADRRTRLRRILLGNAALDVVYLGFGAAVIANRERLGQGARYSAQDAVGDGAAIMVQGGFLLVLDTIHAQALRSQTGDPVGDEVAPDQ